MTEPKLPAPEPRRAFVTGCAEGLPYLLVMLPFGLLFGVAATEAGFDVLSTLAFSVVVIAGAAQFTALQLMTENAPALIVLLTALAVNLRMAMYSAALTPHLGRAPLWQRAIIAYVLVDQTYATAAARFDRDEGWDTAAKSAYFLGVGVPVVTMWLGATLAGAALGKTLPDWLALDFAVPLCFLAMTGPMLRSLPHVVAALVSISGALALSFIPWSLGVLIAAALAMAAGAETERRMTRRHTGEGAI